MKIVLSVALAFFLLGCSQDSKEEVKKSEPKKILQEATTVKSSPIVNIVNAPKEIVVKEVSIDAKAMFKVCTSCHGQNAEKAALGKSKIIKGWSVEDTTVALNGYKDGSYGGPMKALMKGQVNKLNDKQIAAIAEYISKL